MPPNPSVSVLVTTFNHAPFVEEALESLRCQTTGDFEVIITDDASTDGTADVIDAWLDRTGFEATFVRNEANRGICANRNRALALARGEFTCSLSGDDAYQPERIERQLAAFQSSPAQVAAVYSDVVEVDTQGRELGLRTVTDPLTGGPPPSGHDLLARLLLHGNFLLAPAVMVRRSCLDAVGLYDETMRAEDYQMWLRLAARFELVHLPGPLVRYRRVDTSMSRTATLVVPRRLDDLRLLASWLGRTGDPSTDAAVARRLWRLATDLARHGHAEEVRTALRAAARFDRRPGHRTVAAVAGTGAGWRALNATSRVRHRVRTASGPGPS